MSKFGWSYEDASNELDRIIKSTRTSMTSSPVANSSFVSHRSTTSTTPCSICGHNQHNPSSPESLHSHTHHGHSHDLTKDQSYVTDTSRNQSIHFEHSNSKDYYHSSPSIDYTPHTTPSKHEISHLTDYGTSSSRKNVSFSASLSSPPSRLRASHMSSEVRSTPRTPDSALITEAKQSASSVLNAFRELQTKAKIIENERNSAMRIRDELRQELSETRRIQALSRNKQEMRTNDHYLSIKASTEELLGNHSDVHTEIRRLSETSSILKEKLSNQYAKQNVLEDDIRRVDEDISSAQDRIVHLKREIVESQGRVDSMEKRIDTDSAAEERAMQAEIARVKEANEKEKLAAVRADIRLAGLQSYLEIILKVNGDLCEAIRNKEDTDNRAVRMAERQMEAQLHTREREVEYILNKAENIGVFKAMQVSRKVNRYTSPYVMTSPATMKSSGDRRVTFKKGTSASGKRTKSKNRLRSRSVDSQLGPRIYDPSLIEAAARMAATAAATSVVAANTSAHCSACPTRKFIPSGSKSNSEFNVVASVAHAAREAKTLNAKVASKVKSLDFQGTGPLYQDVGRVDLEAMHDHLRLVKRMQNRY